MRVDRSVDARRPLECGEPLLLERWRLARERDEQRRQHRLAGSPRDDAAGPVSLVQLAREGAHQLSFGGDCERRVVAGGELWVVTRSQRRTFDGGFAGSAVRHAEVARVRRVDLRVLERLGHQLSELG